MTAALVVLTAGAVVFIVSAWWADLMDRPDPRTRGSRRRHPSDRPVGWCADCEEPVAGISEHYAERHPDAHAVFCVMCAREVASDCLEEHRRLFHAVRAVGLEDRWTP
jgi:hypothetical protein